MPMIGTFTESITKTQLEQILNEKLKPLEEKLGKFIERDETYKRKLLLLISEMNNRQEMTIDGHDRMMSFLDEWFGKEVSQ